MVKIKQSKSHKDSTQHRCTAGELHSDESKTRLCASSLPLCSCQLWHHCFRPHTLSFPLAGQVTQVWIIWVTMAGSDPCFVQGFANNPHSPKNKRQAGTDGCQWKLNLGEGRQLMQCSFRDASLFSFLETGRSALRGSVLHSKPNEIWRHFIEIRSCHGADGKFPSRDLLYGGEFNLFHHKRCSEELPRHNEMHNRHSESSLSLKKETYTKVVHCWCLFFVTALIDKNSWLSWHRPVS